MPLNPFVWTGPIIEGVPRREFARKLALTLKAGTHVAMFGPRGTGKTSFIAELGNELCREQEDDAPSWELLAVDLRRAISLPAFIGAVSDAVATHPSRELRRGTSGAFKKLEKDIGINLGLVRVGMKTQRSTSLDEAEVLHEQLAAISTVAPRMVVVFDEFQRLNNCPGEPLRG